MNPKPVELIDRKNSFLVVVDIQEKLALAIRNIDDIVATTLALIHGANEFGIPIVFTEHCPDSIGRTLPALFQEAPERKVVSKTHFGTLQEPENLSLFEEFKPKRPIICGIEAHVCVLQTVFGLISEGFKPAVTIDAVASRKNTDKKAGLRRMHHAGAELVTAEMVLFEWLERADVADFKTLLPTIRSLGVHKTIQAS